MSAVGKVARPLDVAVVILNWNGAAHLTKYLPSVVAHSQGARIVMADNGSSDESKAVVDQFSAVEWLALHENYGFAEGYNQALAQVDAEVFVLLNSDVRVTAGWLDAPLRRLLTDPRAAAVQPKVLSDERPTHFEYAGASGGYLDSLGYPFCRGRIFDTVEVDFGQYDDAVEVDWATGAACFVRSAAWRAVGGFDGSYFAHMEEIDLCWRLRKHGYSCWVEPGSTVYHLGGGTLAYASPRKTFLNFRNSLSTLLKNEPGATVLPKLFARQVLDGVAGMKFLAAGEVGALKAVVRSHFAFYGQIPSLLDARRAVASSATEVAAAPLQAEAHLRVTSIVAAYYLGGKRRFSDLAER